MSEEEIEAYEQIIEALEKLKSKPSKKVRRLAKRTQHVKRSLQIEHIDQLKERVKKWSGQTDIAAALIYELYVKAKAYLDQGEVKNAHKFYDLLLRALRISQHALEKLALQEIEEKLRRLEEQSANA